MEDKIPKGIYIRTKVVILRKCLMCNKPFETDNWSVKNGGGKYCSSECAHKGSRKSIIKKCLTCGEKFRTIPSIVIDKKGKYCSRKCFEGKNHPLWKGEDVSNGGLHTWVSRQLGKPNKCEDCGTTIAKKFEWANISGKYERKTSDWKRLCTKCHRKFDYKNIAKGEGCNFSKLTEKDVLKIRKLYTKHKYHSGILAKEFNVCQKTIFHIIKRKTWKHI